MKLTTVLNILIGITLVLGISATANNRALRCVSTNERLLAKKSVFLLGILYGPYRADISYPSKTDRNPRNLTRIVVKDWGSPDSYGFYSLMNGGPGKNYATVSLEAFGLKSLNCTVEFYGY